MTVVAIGFFDGVHLGHQQILKGADIAVTFRNHPLTVLDAAKAPRLIMSYEDRVEAIKACGVKEVVTLDFTPALASQSPEDFLSTLRLRLSTSTVRIRCGANWRFGKGGAGTPDWLREHGVDVQVVEAAEYEGGIVSSTRIRECLSRGEIAAANAMLGRRYRVIGNRELGKGEGRKLGYPTINLSLHNSSLFTLTSSLPLGVYQVSVSGHRAIANYGYAPTFGDRAWKEPMLEVHFLDKVEVLGQGPLSTSTSNLNLIPVEFIKFIRPERKFASPAELQAQIVADIADLV